VDLPIHATHPARHLALGAALVDRFQTELAAALVDCRTRGL